MAPLSKVLLPDNTEHENDDDIVSGPHSMLFGVKDMSVPKTIAHEGVSCEESGKRKREENSPIDQVLIRSDTYESLKSVPQRSIPKIVAPKVFKRSETYDKSGKENCTNSTYVVGLNPGSYNAFTVDGLSYLNENNFPDIINSTRTAAKFDNSIENSNTGATVISRSVCNLNIPLGKSTDIQTAKRAPAVFCEVATRIDERNKKPVIVHKNISTSILNVDAGCQHMNSNLKLNETDESAAFSILKEKALNLEHTNDSFGSNLKFSQAWHSTQYRPSLADPEISPYRRIRATPISFGSSIEDSTPKRDSLEYEESLGILTPEQMVDGISFAASRTPSSENIGSLPEDLENLISKFQYESKSPLELPSPNFADASAKDISLGLIDDRLLSNFTLISDTTMNLELPLDSVDNQSENYVTTRLEQTPSPEELPLDPAPSIELECKTEPTKSKTGSSFINSITSITSLDTGYQGDGEMSRPGSRGPDHSPLTRRPLIRPQPRRPEPMTDSDFYTESDADIIEEHPVRGDRRARVIDGTLYGVDAQTAAEIYVNNRENMDSSGIFTDIEGNALSSAENRNPDVSPSTSDSSSKTISNDSQNPALIQNASIIIEAHNLTVSENNNTEISNKRKSITSSATSSPASVRSPKHFVKDENSAKKYKMPKRNVASKVKAVLESNSLTNQKESNRNSNKKPAGRWDAVMNKISKTQIEKSNLKEVKSKLFCNTSSPSQQNMPQKAPNSRLRRPRIRGEVSSTKGSVGESVHSSASDLSAALPAKRIGPVKKRADVVRVTQVLTAAQLSPASVHKNNVLTENKKNAATAVAANDSKFTPKKNTFLTREKKSTPTPTITAKDCGRAAVKGGRVSPGARPPQQNRVPVVPLPRTIEALTVLLQHLVFNLDAFQTPFLKKQVERSKLAVEKMQLSYRQLEESYELFRSDHQRVLDEERERFQNDIAEMIKQHQMDISGLSEQHSKSVNLLLVERQELEQVHKDQLVKLRSEFTKLQKTHEQSLEILREENDSIREEIDDKNILIKKLEMFKHENEKLDKDFNAKEIKYKDQFNVLSQEIERLKEDNARMMSYASDGKENKLQDIIAEVESLRVVLELKQNEVSDLRKALAQSNQKADLLPSTVEKVSSLTARCEDLQSQLERKTLYESQLISDNKKLQQTLKEEFNHSKRLLHHNEELHWKLCQNKEVVNRVLEQAEESALSRSLATSNFNERHPSVPRQIERTASFRERSLSNKSCNSSENGNYSGKFKNSYDFDFEDVSPPSSPKVKGVVEKSDSVSYVLEMEESPEIIANRIVRRSFRNPTPPKNTPMKSPVNKRPRVKVSPISVSASTSSIVSPVSKINDNSHVHAVSLNTSDNEISSSHSDEVFLWHIPACSTPFDSFPFKNGKVTSDGYLSTATHNIDLDYNDDDDIKLPTLPSEIGRHDAESLPAPQHLAGDVIISESNSEDESTTSSSSGHL